MADRDRRPGAERVDEGRGDVGVVSEVRRRGVLGFAVTRQVQREHAGGARERTELIGPVPRAHPRAVQEYERRRGVAAIVAQVRDTLSLDGQRIAVDPVMARHAPECKHEARQTRRRAVESAGVRRLTPSRSPTDVYSSPAGASHGHTSRSTSETAPKSRIAISESRIIELNASSVFQ